MLSMATNERETLTVAEWQKKIGRMGGKARLTKMTAEDRKRVAKLAAQARWGKKADAPDPNDPKGSKGDQKPSILLSRKPCRQTGVPLAPHHPLLEIREVA